MSSHRAALQPTIALFDLDGTLVDTGGAGRRAMERALEDQIGARRCCDFSFNGLTDRAIVRQALINGEATASDEALEAVIARYLELLAGEVKGSTRYRVLPGVHELLERLGACTNVALGLGTGNVQRGAEVKLERGGLGHHFAFGGFGCDAEDRAELLRVGWDRGAERLGQPAAACRVVVIGDTVRDVAAALAIGAECLAVGTGGVEADVLREAGATAVVATLSDAASFGLLHGQS